MSLKNLTTQISTSQASRALIISTQALPLYVFGRIETEEGCIVFEGKVEEQPLSHIALGLTFLRRSPLAMCAFEEGLRDPEDLVIRQGPFGSESYLTLLGGPCFEKRSADVTLSL